MKPFRRLCWLRHCRTARHLLETIAARRGYSRRSVQCHGHCSVWPCSHFHDHMPRCVHGAHAARAGRCPGASCTCRLYSSTTRTGDAAAGVEWREIFICVAAGIWTTHHTVVGRACVLQVAVISVHYELTELKVQRRTSSRACTAVGLYPCHHLAEHKLTIAVTTISKSAVI